METKNFICTCCKKKFIIPVQRWAPDRGADFFSCDWKEKDMLKHKLCGKCSDSVRKHIEEIKKTMNENSLEYFSKSGIIPLIVSKRGVENEPVLNVTVCGTLDYGKNRPLPDRLELIYRDNEGLEKRKNYSILT